VTSPPEPVDPTAEQTDQTPPPTVDQTDQTAEQTDQTPERTDPTPEQTPPTPAAPAPEPVSGEDVPNPAQHDSGTAPPTAEELSAEPAPATGADAEPSTVPGPADAAPTADAAPAADAAPTETGETKPGGKRRKKKKGKGGDTATSEQQPQAAQPKSKPPYPEPSEIVARIGKTNEQALAYVGNPDPKLSRLSKKAIEALLPELPPVTAGALLGPAALTRHLVASAAAGRYRDLFALWELFRQHPAECKPVLAERSKALTKGQHALQTSVRLGLRGNATRVAEDVRRAEGLIWQWLREALVSALPAVGARPAVASALLEREPELDVPLPDHPNERWLQEAAAARHDAPLAPRVEGVLAANVHRLPATVETLRLATLHYPERVEALVDRVDLDAPEIGAFLAWARDHGAADRLHGRIRERVAGTAARNRAEGLALWFSWKRRGVELDLPESLRTDDLEGFDLSKPETAELAARLVDRGVELNLQGRLELLAGQNRQLAEKAYEAMVCADLDVQLPGALEENPTVNPGTRCPKCRAWTWVRPGHEQRCPRPEPAPEAEPEDPFDLAMSEIAPTTAAPPTAAAPPTPPPDGTDSA
jgi:hypothetical protein